MAKQSKDPDAPVTLYRQFRVGEDLKTLTFVGWSMRMNDRYVCEPVEVTPPKSELGPSPEVER